VCVSEREGGEREGERERVGRERERERERTQACILLQNVIFSSVIHSIILPYFVECPCCV